MIRLWHRLVYSYVHGLCVGLWGDENGTVDWDGITVGDLLDTITKAGR